MCFYSYRRNTVTKRKTDWKRLAARMKANLPAIQAHAAECEARRAAKRKVDQGDMEHKGKTARRKFKVKIMPRSGAAHSL